MQRHLDYHIRCVKSFRIWSYSGQHFPTFGLNMENLSLFNPNPGKCGHFYAVINSVIQGSREGTSSVTFEVLLINCQIYFINNLYKSSIFNCLTLNIKLFIFKLFDVKFLFSENHVFCKQKRTALYGVMDTRP